jgi:hypothetical protein
LLVLPALGTGKMLSKEIQLKYKGNKCSACGLSVKKMLARWGTFKKMTKFHHVQEDKKAGNWTQTRWLVSLSSHFSQQACTV